MQTNAKSFDIKHDNGNKGNSNNNSNSNNKATTEKENKKAKHAQHQQNKLKSKMQSAPWRGMAFTSCCPDPASAPASSPPFPAHILGAARQMSLHQS